MIDSEVIEAVRLIPDGGRTLEEHLIVALADELRSLEEQFDALATCARDLVENMWTVQDGDDGVPFVSAEGVKYLTRKLQELDALLPATVDADA